MLRACLSALVLVSFASCSGLASLREDIPGEPYAFVFLRTGAMDQDLTEEEMSTAMAGHFSNMGRMAEDGHLLIAGPLGDPRSEADHRGIYVFDVTTVAEAEALTATDPAVRASIFRLEAHEFRSPSALRELMPRHEELTERLTAEASARGEELGPGAGGRLWVLASTPDSSAAERMLAPIIRAGRVPFHGTFGPTWEGRALYCLDVETVAEAEQLIADSISEAVSDGMRPETVSWTFHGWYGTSALEGLPNRSRTDG